MTNQMLTRQMDGVRLGLMLSGTDQAPRFSHGGAGISLAQEILLSIGAEYGWPDYKPRER